MTMKNIIFVICLALVAMAAKAEGWTQAATDAGVEYIVENKVLSNSRGEFVTPVKMVYATDESRTKVTTEEELAKTAAYAVASIKFSGDWSEWCLKDIIFYDADGTALKTTVVPGHEVEWEVVKPGSIYESIRNTAKALYNAQ